MKKLRWLVLFVLSAISCTSTMETQIPGYRAKLYKADTVSLQAVAKNKVTFFTVWSIFCGPCLKELPELQTLYSHYKSNHQVSFITLALNTEEELNHFSLSNTNEQSIYRQAFNYSSLTELSLPILIGISSPYQIEKGTARLSDTKTVNHLKQLFTFDAIPTTRIYNRQGRLVFEQQGVESSTVGLLKYRLNLTRKLDSLIAL